ncbi:MAG: tyrosine-protein phosphatase [Acidobacteria bacterium]|nr:tyrosine-protein phosphatase [Acidobacteriota bacterium]
MQHSPVASALLVFTLLFAPAPLLADDRDDDAPAERFVQIEDNLYRGAQPDEDGFRRLRDLGIRTIVSFRNDASEQALVESLGMRFVNIPITFRVFGWGDDFDFEHVQQFMEVVDDPSAGPIFFHCKRGADRTGSIAAIYRIARQGWDAEAAYDEARDRGMRWWYFPVEGKIREFARQLQQSATEQ